MPLNKGYPSKNTIVTPKVSHHTLHSPPYTYVIHYMYINICRSLCVRGAWFLLVLAKYWIKIQIQVDFQLGYFQKNQQISIGLILAQHGIYFERICSIKNKLLWSSFKTWTSGRLQCKPLGLVLIYVIG
jgi:hypothetical protein